MSFVTLFVVTIAGCGVTPLPGWPDVAQQDARDVASERSDASDVELVDVGDAVDAADVIDADAIDSSDASDSTEVVVADILDVQPDLQADVGFDAGMDVQDVQVDVLTDVAQDRGADVGMDIVTDVRADVGFDTGATDATDERSDVSDVGVDVSCPSGSLICSGRCIVTPDPMNCGYCGFDCPTTLPHTASAVCASYCRITCTSGWGNCNSDPRDGCERQLIDGWSVCSGNCRNVQTDPQNCGTCGNVCSAGSTCISGTCATDIVRFTNTPGRPAVTDYDAQYVARDIDALTWTRGRCLGGVRRIDANTTECALSSVGQPGVILRVNPVETGGANVCNYPEATECPTFPDSYTITHLGTRYDGHCLRFTASPSGFVAVSTMIGPTWVGFVMFLPARFTSACIIP